MAGRGKAMATAARLGVKYGPMVYEAVKHGREPAQAAALKAYGRLSARRQALAHAAVLVDGSVSKAFAGDQQVWVVFSGDEPVASHPATDVPFADLLKHADPAKRVRPDEVGRAGRRKRAAESAAAETSSQPSDKSTSDLAEQPSEQPAEQPAWEPGTVRAAASPDAGPLMRPDDSPAAVSNSSDGLSDRRLPREGG